MAEKAIKCKKCGITFVSPTVSWGLGTGYPLDCEHDFADSPPVSTDEPATLAQIQIQAWYDSLPNAASGERVCDKCRSVVSVNVATAKEHYSGECIARPFEMQDAAPEPALSLLVCDFGDFTLVKAEKGNGSFKIGKVTYECPEGKFQTVQIHSFDVVKAALDALGDGEKPVPRLERTASGYTHYYDREEITQQRGIEFDAYDALCQLAGVTLPIWQPKRGKWTRLNTHDWTQAKKDIAKHNEATGNNYGIQTHSFEEAICPVKVWRYTMMTEGE